jgi:acyl-CoA synthetase (AMP-forming)/AMP-acid ligase II
VELKGSEVLLRAVRIAQNLQKQGIDTGDIVSICAANTDNIYPVLFGLIMIQAVVNTLDPNFKNCNITKNWFK